MKRPITNMLIMEFILESREAEKLYREENDNV